MAAMLAPIAGFEPAAGRLTIGCTRPVRLMGMTGGETESRTPHGLLARHPCTPVLSPCPREESNLCRAALQAAALPLSYMGIRLVRTGRIELPPSRWRRETLPLCEVRKAHEQRRANRFAARITRRENGRSRKESNLLPDRVTARREHQPVIVARPNLAEA